MGLIINGAPIPRVHPWKLTWKPTNGGLEDDFYVHFGMMWCYIFQIPGIQPFGFRDRFFPTKKNPVAKLVTYASRQAAKVLIASAVICSGSMPSLLNPSKYLDLVAETVGWLVSGNGSQWGIFREILVKYDYHLAHMGFVWVCFPDKTRRHYLQNSEPKTSSNPSPLERSRILRVC